MGRYECRIGRIKTDITTHRLLAKMAWVATKLYNTALWHSREQWEKTGKIPSGYDLQKVVLKSNYHDMLPAHTYQHTAHQVGMAYKSWYKLRKKDKTANPPSFRKKEELSSLLFTTYGFKADKTNKKFLITLGKQLKDELNYEERLPIEVEWNTNFPENGIIAQIEIVPRNGYFEVHAKIALPEPEWKTEGQVKAIDLGQRIPITAVNEDGKTSMFKGGKVLSHIRYWNKETGRVKSEVLSRSKNKKHNSNALRKMSKHRTRQVKQSIHALTKKVAEDCNRENIKEVVIGDLAHIKKNNDGSGKNWNKKANQNWQQFPIREVVSQLRYKLMRSGIRLIEIDEHGTSKGRCSACGNEDRKTMRRVHRGMFCCDKCNTYTHADINGAKNILVRYLHQIGKTIEGSSGCLAQPLVHRWDNHNWVIV